MVVGTKVNRERRMNSTQQT